MFKELPISNSPRHVGVQGVFAPRRGVELLAVAGGPEGLRWIVIHISFLIASFGTRSWSALPPLLSCGLVVKGPETKVALGDHLLGLVQGPLGREGVPDVRYPVVVRI